MTFLHCDENPSFMGQAPEEEIPSERLATMETSYEQAESDATSYLSHKFIVEKAYPAEKKAYPIRWLIVVLSTFSSVLLAIVGILVKNQIELLKD